MPARDEIAVFVEPLNTVGAEYMATGATAAIENDRVNLGVERAKVLARALKCHPAVLVFPGWDVARESAA